MSDELFTFSSFIRLDTLRETIILDRGCRWWLMYVFARFEAIKRIVLIIHNFWTSTHLADVDIGRETIFPDLDIEESLNSLETHGFAAGFSLSQQVVNSILQFTATNPCFANNDLNLGFFYAQKKLAQAKCGERFILASYYNITLQSIIQHLVHDPKLLAIATKYLGCYPRNSENRLWWSFASEVPCNEKSRYAQTYHYDVEDYACLRFFFYLSEVDLSRGPHVCIRGSHKCKKLSHLLSLHRRRCEQEVIDYYGAGKVVTFTGSTGYGFAEDPFCLHKGLTPIAGDRLILQIQYSMNSYGVSSDIRDPALLNLL
jgi:hypothetical protein